MLKTIKLYERAYEDAKELRERLEKEDVLEGVYKVNLSTAISYAIKKALEELNKKRRFLSAAGGWSDIDKSLIKEIYEGRKKGTRWDMSLD
ncbi:hypothetical protein HYU14_01620 [Candidatus Woesearchaeota archaeon]|nr:hypothetical protein [Candidatus Woesearchaeota archaeon]